MRLGKIADRAARRERRLRSTSPCQEFGLDSATVTRSTQTADELIDLFGRFGFSVARGPEVEDVYHNFDALNIPANHPARDPFDNFYLAAPAGSERAVQAISDLSQA